ncbi:MAG: GNAT family N-acetyltransferase, partial [Candidatus Cloacimonetes bacterium]|nr:GNAT family N-acetyltransferase [Candidatus Cloacimonadota bacterium]
MKPIIIVEYNPSLAKRIAEMWNNSGEGWNGNAGFETEQSVKDKEEKASHLNLYIALDGDLVVGYCKLSRYAFDENTLYIDLLNVLPSYHGQKIGKMLILKSVERTIELNYPRLDLFTWAGNTKAVPLYKKTGFFWEKMESNSTHLMNFIPTVLSTELIRNYIEAFDWYDDSDRVIEICPDGVKKNDFDLLTYSWKKDEQKLSVSFEKTGRGIQAIDCQDFLIECLVTEPKLVFGKSYPVQFRVVNKSNQPLNIKIKGLSDKNIRFDCSIDQTIEGEQHIESEFFIEKIDRPQSMWTTHPCVKAEVEINGKKAVFKTGINTQFPLSVHQFHRSKDPVNLVECPVPFVFNIKNGYKEACDFTIRFPELANIHFTEPEISVSLKSEEKKSVATQVILKKTVVYSKDIEIEVRLAQHRFSYHQKMDLKFPAYKGQAAQEMTDSYLMLAGKNMIKVDKETDCNEMFFNNLLSNLWAYINPPKIGKPFSSEFKNQKPCKAEFKETDEAQTLTLYHQSKDFPGCRFACHYKLYNYGMLEYQMELLEFPENQTEVYLSHSLNFSAKQQQMPYQGEIIQTDDSMYNDSEITYWNSQNLDENWFFNEQGHSTIAVIWDQSVKAVFSQWEHIFEHHFDLNSSRLSPKLMIAMDYFHSPEQVRHFAMGLIRTEKQITKSMELIVNNGNPFIQKQFKAVWKDKKEKMLEGEFSFQSEDVKVLKKAEQSDQLHEISADFSIENYEPLRFVEALAVYQTKQFSQKKAVFLSSEHKTERICLKKEGHNVWQVNNGVIEFSASDEFAPSVFSLKYKGQEWLDSNFPEKGPKSWWNPWIGGICVMPTGFRMFFYLEEKTSVELTEKTDQMGN